MRRKHLGFFGEVEIVAFALNRAFLLDSEGGIGGLGLVAAGHVAPAAATHLKPHSTDNGFNRQQENTNSTDNKKTQIQRTTRKHKHLSWLTHFRHFVRCLNLHWSVVHADKNFVVAFRIGNAGCSGRGRRGHSADALYRNQ